MFFQYIIIMIYYLANYNYIIIIFKLNIFKKYIIIGNKKNYIYIKKLNINKIFYK